MLFNTFEYVKPNSLVEVLLVLDELRGKKTKVLAGGTDLIPSLRARTKAADYVVDLGAAGLDQVVFEKDQVRIGALVTFAALCRHPEIQAKLPVIVEAAGKIGAVQTRTLATIGGNLCEGVPSNDSAPPMLILDAKFRLQAKGKERLVAVENFFVGPRRTVLEPGEIMTEILIPLRAEFHASFLRFGRRKALTLAVASAAAGLAVSDGRQIVQARVALERLHPHLSGHAKQSKSCRGRRSRPACWRKRQPWPRRKYLLSATCADRPIIGERSVPC